MLMLGVAGEEVAFLIPVIAIAGGVAIAITAIVNANHRRVAQTREREQSRRELAAYVAEGTISPGDAVKLMEAGTKPNMPLPMPPRGCKPSGHAPDVH